MADRPRSDTAEKAIRIYEERIRPLVEKEHFGKVVSIDADSGDDEIEREGEDWFESVRRLRAPHPNPRPFSLRIGGTRPKPRARLERLGQRRLRGGVLHPFAQPRIIAILDTGFTDELHLPSETIQGLGLVSSGETRVTLGDGSVVFMNVYELEVEWNDAWRRVKVYEGEDDALIGVSLLKGLEVCISFVVGGTVRVSPI